MEYYLDINPEKKFKLNNKNIIGEPGHDGAVYKYNDLAIKLLHKRKGGFAMNFEKATLFKEKLRLKASLNLMTLLYNIKDNYQGYGTKYEQENLNLTINMTVINFLENIRNLKYDIKQFSKYHYHIIDMRDENCICNNQIHPIDFDQYYYDKDMSDEEIALSNINGLKQLIIQIIGNLINELLKDKNINQEVKQEIIMNNEYQLQDGLSCTDIEDYFSMEMSNYKTIKEYLEMKIYYIERYINRKSKVKR